MQIHERSYVLYEIGNNFDKFYIHNIKKFKWKSNLCMVLDLKV